ncbi:hypothetical protein [Streptomyces sp. NPDC007088]|uniref:hypothetical protein n=1 Tax=Streptomyces sp. NPDC007088 TaxID=3364773 RepID=UPI0036BF8F3C
MSTRRQSPSRRTLSGPAPRLRSFGRLTMGVAGGAGLGAVGADAPTGGRRPAHAPLRIMAINHVWSPAVRKRMKAFEASGNGSGAASP